MFVAKWEPGVIPTKPKLSSAPIWLELRNVPYQFFHEEGLERIASLVGEPEFLHPSTANKTNLEVAKVFTIIDPRKPLPEAVNVQFDTGEIRRVLVSSPWMPPVCSHCKEIGHSLRHCRAAPVTCTSCSSTTHMSTACPKLSEPGQKKRRTQRRRRSKTPVYPSVNGREGLSRSDVNQEWQIKSSSEKAGKLVSECSGIIASGKPTAAPVVLEIGGPSKSGIASVVSATDTATDTVVGPSLQSSSDIDVSEDSSDVLSSESDTERFI